MDGSEYKVMQILLECTLKSSLSSFHLYAFGQHPGVMYGIARGGWKDSTAGTCHHGTGALMLQGHL